MKKNDIVKGRINAIGSSGEGIMRYLGTTIFVPFSLCGELIECKILKVKGNIAFGKVEKIIESSKDRVKPVCPAFYKCGGCQLQHTNYQNQLAIKQKTVSDAFSRIAYLPSEFFSVSDVVASNKEFRYRNKLQLPIRRINGKNVVGFFRENSHDIVEVDDCPLQPEWVKSVIKLVKEYIQLDGVKVYSENDNSDGIRHIVVRETNNKALIAIVNDKPKLYNVNRLIEGLSKIFNSFSLFINVNNRQDNVILTEEFVKVCGDDAITLNEFGIEYEIGIGSFYQVNDYVKSLIYKKVIELVASNSDSVIIDAYSGAGVLTAMLSKNAKLCYGIEIIAEAVKIADKLKERNNFDGKMFNICGDCVEELPKLIESLSKRKDIDKKNISLVLDPPRKGIERNIIEAINKCQIEKIVYVSCSPQTLARDVGLLVGSLTYENDNLKKSQNFEPKFDIEYLTPYDMFPATKHIETLVCLRRKK